MNLFKRIFRNTNDFSTRQASKTDIISCIDKFGLHKTFDALQATSSNTRDLIETKGKLNRHEERFEFELFAFSYYLSYLREINLAKHALLFNKVVDFYSNIAIELAELDPSEIYLRILLSKDKDAYIIDKIKAYQLEITNMKVSKNQFAKYTFASFYIYQMSEAKSIKSQSEKIIGNNIIDFHKDFFVTIEMLRSISEELMKYVVWDT